jgi:mycothiol synthase
LATPQVEIKDLDPHRAGEWDRKLLNDFDNLRHAEQWPEDSPRTVDETLGHWRFVPRYLDLHQWAAWAEDNTRVVARASINIGRYDENRHLADFDIYVVPSMRRQGIATNLLRLVAQVAQSEGRTLLLVSTDAAIPAGRAFVQRLGGRAGVASSTNQLKVEDLNRQLVAQWLARGRRREREFELGLWDGPYPSHRLEAMAAIKEVMNTAPTDELEIDEFRWMPDDLIQDQQSLAQQGIHRWTMYVRHRESDEIAGFTEVFRNPRHPELLVQGHTAVMPRFQNRGLAQWLKGEMLEKIVQELPEVRRIRSDNADSNVAMLRINRRLGFRRYKAWTTWQVDLDQVHEYLRQARPEI